MSGPLVTVYSCFPQGFKLTGMVSASANSNPNGDGYFIAFGGTQIPQDVWTAWKLQIGGPSGLIGVAVSGP